MRRNERDTMIIKTMGLIVQVQFYLIYFQNVLLQNVDHTIYKLFTIQNVRSYLFNVFLCCTLILTLKYSANVPINTTLVLDVTDLFTNCVGKNPLAMKWLVHS